MNASKVEAGSQFSLQPLRGVDETEVEGAEEIDEAELLVVVVDAGDNEVVMLELVTLFSNSVTITVTNTGCAVTVTNTVCATSVVGAVPVSEFEGAAIAIC